MNKTKYVVMQTQSAHHWWEDGPEVRSYIYGVYDSRHEAIRGVQGCCEIATTDYFVNEGVNTARTVVLDNPDHKIIMEVAGKKLDNGQLHYSSIMTTIRIIERC